MYDWMLNATCYGCEIRIYFDSKHSDQDEVRTYVGFRA